MWAGLGETPARELFRDAAFPASDSSLFFNLSTPLARFREDITWRRPQVRWVGLRPHAPSLGGRAAWAWERFLHWWAPRFRGPLW
jgi:hypothetical protein